MLRNINPDRLMVDLNGAENTAQTGVGAAGLPANAPSTSSGFTQVSLFQNTIFDCVYLPAVDTFVVSFVDESGAQQDNVIEAWQEDANGVFIKKDSKVLNTGFTVQQRQGNIAVKGDATIGCIHISSSTVLSVYEATVDATGNFTSEFTTNLTTASPNDYGITYNETEDRWVAYGFRTTGSAVKVETIVPGSITIEASDTRTSTSAASNTRSISSHSNSKCVFLDNTEALTITVNAGGTSVTFEEASKVTITANPFSVATAPLLYMASNDVHIGQDANDLRVYTVSGDTITQGAGQTATSPAVDVTDVTYNKAKGRLFITAGLTVPSGNAGDVYREVTESGGTLTFGTTYQQTISDSTILIASEGDKLHLVIDRVCGSNHNLTFKAGTLIN